MLSGGVSGALILRLTAAGRESVLRIEPERIALEDRARHFAAMAMAAAVGAAPALHFADPKSGVCVMDYLAPRPLVDHPGGAVGLARGMGDLLAKVRAAAPFADFGPYPELISVLLARLGASGRFSTLDLAPCREGLTRIAEALVWDGPIASTHNDVSPRNLIFDGARLWLVDWELAWLSDPLVDLAIASTELAVGDELEHELLASSFGRAPDAALLARLAVTRLLTRLAYGVIVFDSLPPEPDSLALALTPEDFRAAIAEGRLAPGSRDITAAFARMSLTSFVRGVEAPGFGELLARAGQATV
ncbi:phosphotransferase [Phenylobacterium sp.]|uniref:phosphotransferase n=1 Tax=Phenylobacterium sp. TaxID=1871053 RepID=UPI0037CCA8B6